MKRSSASKCLLFCFYGNRVEKWQLPQQVKFHQSAGFHEYYQSTDKFLFYTEKMYHTVVLEQSLWKIFIVTAQMGEIF